MPFALIEKNANCLHHGVLTFRYRGESEVSRVAYQVSHETCWYFQFDAWGTAAATRVADLGFDPERVALAYRTEAARRLPVKPIEQLGRDHPGLDTANFGSEEDIDPRDMTVYGVLVRGVHYAGGCETRMGRYPYCDEMPLPSYSLAKTIMAGLALMRAEVLHPGVRNFAVADYVPECREAGGWDGVTFENLLDMATGRYGSTTTEADEDAMNTGRFFIATTHAEKIRIACTHFPRKDAPGKRWVYHTTDTYILGAALAAWWKQEKGADADFYRDLLVEPVFKRLGLSPELATPRRTLDAAAQPFTGWGLVLRRDDLVKLGGFLALGDGTLGQDRLFDAAMLRAAMQRDPADRGLQATNRDFRYNNGVWAWNIAETLGCKQPAWIPFMSGFGGISVVMMPNGDRLLLRERRRHVPLGARGRRDASHSLPICRGRRDVTPEHGAHAALPDGGARWPARRRAALVPRDRRLLLRQHHGRARRGPGRRARLQRGRCRPRRLAEHLRRGGRRARRRRDRRARALAPVRRSARSSR